MAAWNEFLDADEWAALYSGVPAPLIRPWALVFWSPARASSSPEWYWLPQAQTCHDFSHKDTAYSADDYYPMVNVGNVQDGTEGGTTATWSPFTRVKEGVVPSEWRDTGVVNGVTYKYKLKARDTSDNESGFSSESATVTPTGGIQGDPLPPPIMHGAMNARLVRAQHAQRHFG